MNASTKAIEKSKPDAKPVKILAAAGNLRAMLWKPNGRWKVAIVREDRVTGEISDLFSPDDIINLAELATLIAQALHVHADLDDVELSDDLGCLGHNLAKTLGITLEASEFVMKPTIQ